jgi:hypothetical protein
MDDFIKKKHKITLDKKNHRYFTPLSQQIVNKYVKGNHSMNNTLDLN